MAMGIPCIHFPSEWQGQAARFACPPPACRITPFPAPRMKNPVILKTRRMRYQRPSGWLPRVFFVTIGISGCELIFLKIKRLHCRMRAGLAGNDLLPLLLSQALFGTKDDRRNAPPGGLPPKQSSDWDPHYPHHPYPKYENKKCITNQPIFGC